ncbi:afadin- and alpha-actinin-binding protein B isoform X2 [Brachyhypopomus gauderio]|uniref:afadin- and alpha-actinin-binding protein B isoform X2 n=1 Tax=Brachyhypopomus gauderio TaxID=698409 RepID=UPI004043335F
MMAYKHEIKKLTLCGRGQDSLETRNTYAQLQASSGHNTASFSTPYRAVEEEREHTEASFQNPLAERDQHIARLQDALRCERQKNAKMQSRFNQQGAELRRKDQLISRMREKLVQFTDRHRNFGLSIDIKSTLPKPSGRREPASRTTQEDGRKEEVLQLMLERREAELREAMKLRHSLTTLLHALRADMQQTLQNDTDTEEEEDPETSRLIQSEQSLGDHVTGGVVLEWMHVQKKLRVLLSQSPITVRTDQEKLLARVEEELEQSRDLVQVQQQLLEDNIAPPLPDVLIGSYYLEEWEQLQDMWVELNHQRHNFQQERQAFTDAAIRLGRERCEFEQQKASLLKQQFLSASPVRKTSHSSKGWETAHSDAHKHVYMHTGTGDLHALTNTGYRVRNSFCQIKPMYIGRPR